MAGTRLLALIDGLRNIGPTSDAKIKFIVDTTFLDNQGQASPTGERIITGRLLPNSNMYSQGSIRVDIILGPSFPFQPPKVILRTEIYHPNVDEKGEISVDTLNPGGSWTPKTTLVTVVEKVTDLIDNPSVQMVQNLSAASLFDANRDEYERVASEKFNANCAPRN